MIGVFLDLKKAVDAVGHQNLLKHNKQFAYDTIDNMLV